MGEFRTAYFARDYEACLAFYRDGLGLPELECWDRGADDRGTMFEAGDGRIEILARPAQPDPDSVWDHRPPQGVLFVLERDDVEELYERAVERGLEIRESLRDQRWGHRSFVVADPEGVGIYVYAAGETSETS